MRRKVKKRSLQRYLRSAIVSDPVESAKAAGLRYVLDDRPGIRRQCCGKGFTYFDPNGERICERKKIQRIKSLAIPPAYDADLDASPHLVMERHLSIKIDDPCALRCEELAVVAILEQQIVQEIEPLLARSS